MRVGAANTVEGGGVLTHGDVLLRAHREEVARCWIAGIVQVVVRGGQTHTGQIVLIGAVERHADDFVIGDLAVAEAIVGDAVRTRIATEVDRANVLQIQTGQHRPGHPLEGITTVQRSGKDHIAADPLQGHGIAFVVEPTDVGKFIASLSDIVELAISRVVVGVDRVSVPGAVVLVALQGADVAVVLALEHLRHFTAEEQRGAEGRAVRIAFDPGIGESEVRQATELAVGDVERKIPGTSEQVAV